jgi:hypothetical protein
VSGPSEGTGRPFGADADAGNEEYLAAALEWLRLRLASCAAAQEAELIVPADPGTAPDPSPQPQAQRWRRRGLPGPAADVSRPAARPVAALPGARPAPGPEGRLEAAEEAMRAAADRTPAPAAVRLGRLLGLTPFELNTMLLCAAMELDPQMGELCAKAQGIPSLAHPTFALALRTLPEPTWDVLSPHGGLRWWRLIEISQPPGQPLVTSALRADERIVNYLKGLNELDDRLEPFVTPLPAAASGELADSQRATVRAASEWCRRVAARSAPPVLQLVGPDRLSKQLVAAETAAGLGLQLLPLSAESLPPQAADLETLARLWSREHVLLGTALYLDAEELDGDAQQLLVARFLARAGGLSFLAVREPWQRLSPPTLAIDVERPTRAEQREAWAAALGPAVGAVPGMLAAQFDLNLPTITEIAHSQPDGPDPGRGDRLWDACLATTRPRLDTLAQRMEPKATWRQLVLPDAELALLHEIAHQVAQRSTVYERWGFAERMTRGLGISALFTGPSGTGKTMAAEVIANELRLNLYRIDLSAVVSKYIGETEKNLRRLFDAAEEGAALLFFDECDALFGKRSEVKDSHDRYANIEINYLLQRMESYRGLAVLATNMRGALDQAFLRRLRFIVTFAAPGPADRRAIWERVFPERTPKDPLDLDRLADFAATGGMIHNIALNAAFAAAHADGPVTMRLVLDSLRTEFRKLEIPVRDRDFTPEASR